MSSRVSAMITGFSGGASETRLRALCSRLSIVTDFQHSVKTDLQQPASQPSRNPGQQLFRMAKRYVRRLRRKPDDRLCSTVFLCRAGTLLRTLGPTKRPESHLENGGKSADDKVGAYQRTNGGPSNNKFSEIADRPESSPSTEIP